MGVMTFLRNNMKIIFVVTIVGFIAATFAGFGGYYLNQKQGMIAKVDATKISKEEYENYLFQLTMRAQEENQAPVTDEQKKELQDQVLQMLIQKALLLKEVKNAGMQISDKEIMSAIQSVPAFQVDGKFSQTQYFNTLKYSIRQTPQDFEKNIGEEMLQTKIKRFIMDGIKISESELRDAYYSAYKDMKDYEKNKQEFMKSYSSQKGFTMLNTWYVNIGNKAKVNVYQDNITN